MIVDVRKYSRVMPKRQCKVTAREVSNYADTLELSRDMGVIENREVVIFSIKKMLKDCKDTLSKHKLFVAYLRLQKELEIRERR